MSSHFEAAAVEIGDELIPRFDDLTTEELYAAVQREVSKRRLSSEIVGMAMDYIHTRLLWESIRQEVGGGEFESLTGIEFVR